MGWFLILHAANFIIPILGDLKIGNLSGDSAGWGDDIGTIWWPLLRIVFKKAKSVQVVRLQASEAIGSAIWSDLVPNFHRRLRKSVTVWNASSDSFAHDIRQMGHVNEDSRYFLLVIGSDHLRQLADSPIWFSRSNYVILVENSDKCSNSFNFIFRRRIYIVPHLYFVLSKCPELAYIVEPDVPNSSVMLSENNVTVAVSMWHRNIPELRNSSWKVTMFGRFPTAAKVIESKQKWTDFEGIDGFFLETISDYYELKPVMVDPDDGQTYGTYENDTASGTLGVVLRGEADIAMNGRFLIDYGTSEVDFTSPYLTDSLCIMAPRSERVPSYIAMFRCFDLPAWILLLLAFIVGSFVWSTITRGFDDKNSAWCKPTASRDVYFMILAGLASKSSPKTPSARIFIASCLFFSIVFMGAFQGLLYKSMTSPTFYPELNTLEDVDRSGYLIMTASQSLKDAFPPDDNDPLIQRLRSKLRVVRNDDQWSKIKDDTNYASLYRRNGAFLRLHRFGKSAKFHLVNECPRSYFLSFILQKKSPFLNTVNSFITRCHENGLLQLWRDRTYKFTAEDLHYTEDFEFSVGLRQVQAPFFLLCLGLVSSAIAFFYENATQRRKPEGAAAPRVTWWRYNASCSKSNRTNLTTLSMVSFPRAVE